MNSTMLWYATRASGIAALILLTATMLLGLVATNRPRARNWPGFAQQEIHRRISILSVVFVGIHVITSLLDTYVHIGWASILVPFTSSYSRLWVGVGTVGLDLMLAVFISSLLRSRIRPTTWRALHWLAYLCWPVALAHTFGIGTDAAEPWVVALGLVCIASVSAALLWRVRASTNQNRATQRTNTFAVPRKHLATEISKGNNPGIQGMTVTAKESANVSL
jgi:methionine sulfoxide reductase heme-binding subunit